MAIRKFEFVLSTSGIEPAIVKRVGVQYEHNATQIDFLIPKELYSMLPCENTSLIFRVDAVDGEGGYHPSKSLDVIETDSYFVLSYNIEYDVAQVGGICRLTVIASRIDATGNEDLVYCSAPAIVEIEGQYRNEVQYSEFEGELSGILNEAKGCVIASTQINENGELLVYYSSGAYINAGKITLPNVDNEPVENSEKPVSSGGVYKKLLELKDAVAVSDYSAMVGYAYGTDILIDDAIEYEHKLELSVENNLLPFPYYDKTKADDNNLLWTVNDDGSISVNGTSSTLDTPFYLYKGEMTLPLGEYVFYLDSYANTDFKTAIYGDNGLIAYSENSESITLSLSEDTKITEVYIYPNGLATFENVIISPSLSVKGLNFADLKLKVLDNNLTELVEYNVNAEGIVENAKSIYPVINISTSPYMLRVYCEYKRDINTAFGDVESALDGIIAIQNTLIGGDA